MQWRPVEMHTAPTGPADEPDYQVRQVFGPNDNLPLILENQAVGQLTVHALLP